MKTTIKITTILTLLLLSTYSQAQDGSLDLSFGTGGIVTTNIANTEEEANAVCVQPDGKILALGYFYNGIQEDMVLIRYHSNGTIDSAFGTNGIVLLHITACGTIGTSICLQPDGKILVAGYISTSVGGTGDDFFVARYNSNGTIDNTFGIVGPFGPRGYTTLDFGNSTNDGLKDIQLQPDGKILVAGMGGYNFAVVRYNSNGSLDLSFSNDGIVTTPIGNGGSSANAMVLQPDGKILLTGTASIANSAVIALVRYNNNGSLDLSFDSDGIVTTDIGTNSEVAYDIDLQSDGKILVTGYYSGAHFLLIRYNSNGSLDTSLDMDGIVTTNIPNASGGGAYKVKQLPNGKILLGGYLIYAHELQFVLFQCNSDGSLDTSFGMNGFVVTSIGDYNKAYTMYVQSDGKIVLTGISFNGINNDFAIVRYNSDGSLDLSFSNDGIVISSIYQSSIDYASDICLQPDGKILIAGDFNNNPEQNVAVVRYNVDGSLDFSFGFGGIAPASSGYNNNDLASAIALQPDGKVLVAGSSILGIGLDRDFHLFRYNSNGSLDGSFGPGTFGTGGMTSTSIGNNEDYTSDMYLQPDGKILVAGYSHNGIKSDFILIRYNSNGILDNSFGIGGIATTVIGNGADVNAMDLQPDGKILLVGGTSNGTGNDFAVVRYNSNGSLDSSFDFDGIIGTPVGNLNATAFAVKSISNGKILVAGTSDIGPALVQYNNDGSLDTTFDSDGIMIIPTSNTLHFIYDIYVQSDGKILCVGIFTINASEHDFAIARFNSNGSIDSTFGTNGNVVTPVGSSNADDLARGVCMQPDGKILIVGASEGVSSSMDFAIVRYNNPTININYVESNLLNLSIYPNPFKTTTSIEFGTTLNNAELSIYNLFGQKLKTISNISNDKINLNRDELPAGSYLVSLTQDKKVIATEKLIITD